MKTSSEESKFTVASILSSMASGHGLSPGFSEPGPSFAHPVTTISTGNTPILTPTTLANLEQTFIELSSVPSQASQSNIAAEVQPTVTLDSQIAIHRSQSGFVPPVVDQAAYSDESSNDQDWYTPPAKRIHNEYSVNGSAILIATDNTGNARKRPTGPRKRKLEEHLSAEEEQRRTIRRERNKLAAAKCRQRRVDQTNQLTHETEELEEVKASLENEVETLKQVKEHLEFVLQAHKPLCTKHKAAAGGIVQVKTEPSSSDSCTDTTTASTTTAAPTARPTSLALPASLAKNEVGIPVTTPSSIIPAFTPSSMITTLGLDNLIDGHTGLTPLIGSKTGLTPLLSGSTGLTPLLTGTVGSTGFTPTTAGPSSANCATQQRESDGSSPENPLNSPTPGHNLITL